MAIKLQIRRGLAADWANPSNNPVLLLGELGLETDTGNFKIGDGTTAWNSLAYARVTYPQIGGAGNDLNVSAYQAQGRYEIGVSVVTNVPTDWTPASDAPGILLVTRIATGSIAQVLFSTKTQKVFCRAWDGTTYTTWVAMSLHADSVGTTQIVNLAVTTPKIADDAVTFAKIQNSAASGLSVVGRSTNSAGDFAEINAANDFEVLRRNGTAVGFGTVSAAGLATDSVTTTKILNSAVTAAKMGTQVVMKSQVFTATGTWTAPSSTGGVVITVIGGGGGGGSSNNLNIQGGQGGDGGRIQAYLSVTPGVAYAVTVGAGGAGSNSTDGASGGTSTFLGVTATGGGGGITAGANGADGSGSNGTQPSGVTLHASYRPYLLGGQRILQWNPPIMRTSFTTPAVAFSVTGTNPAGSGGSGEVQNTANNASGGVGGLVEVEWFEFA